MHQTESKEKNTFYNIANNIFDIAAHPEIHFAGRNWNSYILSQVVGINTGAIVIILLTSYKNLSLPVTLTVIFISILLSTLLYTSINFAGHNNSLIEWARGGVYHYQILVIISATVFLLLAHEPVLSYLDVIVTGVALAQVFGRAGCLMTGCCHGRPHGWGVMYTNEHTISGYKNYLRGVRLLPVQLIEALYLILIFFLCLLMILRNNIPGEVFSFYIISYGAGRFFIEFIRADAGRIYLIGFSEAQLTAVILTSIISALELYGILFYHLWHILAAALLLLIIICYNLKNYFYKSKSREYFHPEHLEEITEVLRWISGIASMNLNTTTEDCEGVTSRGLKISLEVSTDSNNPVYNYTILSSEETISFRTARRIAKLIVRMLHNSRSFKITNSSNGVSKVCVS